MLDKKVAELLNDQINKELYSAYIYLDMANFYADYGLDGFENWFYIQAHFKCTTFVKLILLNRLIISKNFSV